MKNMKKWVGRILRLKSERGSVTVIVGISLTMFIGFAALAVDIGYLMVTRNELQNVADASALAGTGWLGNNYDGMTFQQQQDFVVDREIIVGVVNGVALQNRAGGANISINDADVVIGYWDPADNTLTERDTGPNAVRVTARRDGGANGPITTFFAGVLGNDTAGVSAFATAALSALGEAELGGLPFPAAIAKERFESEFCDQPIKFYPTTTSCAGWHTYDESPSSAAKLKKILEGLTDGTYESPAVTAGDVFEFTGGTLASAFPYMQALFDAMKVLNDGDIDSDNNSETWTTAVVVYDAECSVNPTGPLTIVGIATVTITEVTTSPEKTIWAEVRCNAVEPGRGGGGSFGTLGTIPGLVE